MPLVKQKTNPDFIAISIFTQDEMDAVISLMGIYRRSKTDWDTYSHKVPPVLLTKLTKYFSQCRMNGYVNPHVVSDKMAFDQIVTTTGSEFTDGCTMCGSSIDKGSCRGSFTDKGEFSYFTPCWRNENG